jgi:phosphoribosylformimino-5-aminoimidazole carboxamide ribotide isomerase
MNPPRRGRLTGGTHQGVLELMIAIPAVDLRDGACVQLLGGSHAREQLRPENPAEVARSWTRYGFRRLHVADLDAATGRGRNLGVVREILHDTPAEVQVGGGIRESDQIADLFGDGASRVVVGTRALEEPEWLAEIAEDFPGQVIVASDVRDRHLVTRGWARTFPVNILDAIEELNEFPLGGLLITAVHREGQMQGVDLPLMEDIAEASRVPVFASGGVASVRDLRALAYREIAGVVVGMALYTGALDPRAVAGEFGE